MPRLLSRPLLRLARRTATVAAALVLVLGGSLTSASATPAGGYYDGLIEYSTITNCASIIWGSPYAEKGAGAYAGVYHDPDAGFPAVNQTTYVHLVIHGLGNACSGQYFVPSIGWNAAGLQFDTTQPIFCYNTDGQVTGADCPQWGSGLIQPGGGPGGSLRYWANNPTKANMWPLPVGKAWEFQFPVKPTTAKVNTPVYTYFEMADGNDNPTLSPQASLYTFGVGTPPSVQYDAPSTTPQALAPDNVTVPKYGVISRAHLNVQGQTGTMKMQIGTRSGSYDGNVSLALGASYSSVDLWTDWDEAGVAALRPGTTYYWRAGFDPGAVGGADTVWGAEQRFTQPAARLCLGRPVTVALSMGGVPTDGDDVILGTTGKDKVSAGAGHDVVCGLGGDDVIDPGAGNDLVDAGGGNDLVLSVAGDDASRGGSGSDTISYAGAPAAITLDLGVSTEQSTGAGLDVVTGFENAIGGNLADVVAGTSGANRLFGTKGGDRLKGLGLKGLGGDDRLDGGGGKDTCDGGGGKDTATACEVRKSIP